MSSRYAEFRQGWPVLLAASLGVACGASPVPFYAIGAFAVPLTEAFGWGRGEVMLAVLPLTLAVILVVPFVGALADRIGVRPVALATLAAFGLCFGALALSTGSLPLFYATWFVMGLVGGGSTPVSWTRGVIGWFRHNRGLALAFTLMGTGLTAAFLPQLAAWLIATGGWRLAFAGIALLPLGVALPVAFLLFREPPAAPAPVAAAPAAAGLPLRAALRDYRFWVLACVILLVGIQTAGTVTNLQPLLRDRGYTLSGAAGVAGVIGISIICGRLLTGWLIDRFWAPGVAFPLLVLPAIACLLLTGSTVALPVALLSAAMIGLAAGAETDLVAYLSARYFGLRHYGRIYGVQYAVFVTASGIAPFLFGRTHDLTGSYDLVLYLSAAMVVTGALLLLTMGRYPPA